MPRKSLLEKLISSPQTSVEELDLVYVDDRTLPISRLKRGRGFSYYMNDRPLKNKKHIQRIKDLVIPPAWQEVRITHLPNGHLQAVGKDVKNRKQYIYHLRWLEMRNQTKFYKMVGFGKKLPSIRKRVERDLRQKGWPKSKVLALIIKLMEETHIRIGSEKYAKMNHSYGLTTLRKKHVDIYRSKMKFEFTGKKGKKHSVTIRNKKLADLVSRCEDIAGWELFQYFDQQGKKQSVDSGLVNGYLNEICGTSFTAKDFRTWAASVLFFDALMDLGTATDKNEKHRNLLRGFDTVAEALGNTRNVCRKYYVHPVLVSCYENDSIEKSFKVAKRQSTGKKYFLPSEIAMLQLIQKYRPEFS